MRNLIPLAVIVTLALVFCGGEVRADTSYDAVADFSFPNNPSGAWSYGVLSAMTGGTFAFDGSAGAQNGGAIEVWTSGSSEIIYNATGSTYSWGPNILPATELGLAPHGLSSDVRWAAPLTGTYDVSGFFDRIDTTSSQPVTVAVVKNATTVLFQADNFITYGQQKPFSFSQLSLGAEDTLDFYAINTGSPSNIGVGLAATITPVPEPCTATLLVGGLLALVGAAWRRKGAMLGGHRGSCSYARWRVVRPVAVRGTAVLPVIHPFSRTSGSPSASGLGSFVSSLSVKVNGLWPLVQPRSDSQGSVIASQFTKPIEPFGQILDARQDVGEGRASPDFARVFHQCIGSLAENRC